MFEELFKAPYTGPRGGELVSVAHYGEQNGDLMRDPEVVFEVAADQWQPVSIQQDYIGSYREAVFVGENGKVLVRPAEVRDIASFARFWDRNLKLRRDIDPAVTLAAGIASEDAGALRLRTAPRFLQTRHIIILPPRSSATS